jgi:N-succinyldiaminopimelate aminotransferase
MNPDLERLQPYPFARLANLLNKHTPPDSCYPILLSIGEPKHAPPKFALNFLAEHLSELARYPTTKGIPELRIAIANWLTRRFTLNSIDPEAQILPVNGTREAIFSFTQAAIDRTRQPIVVSPNPFYQIYEGAAYLAGARLFFTPCLDSLAGLPDFDSVPDTIWRQCQLLFICSPGNPTGKVIPANTLQKLIDLADQHDFIIAADECYSEIYQDEDQPPVGLLQVCAEIDRHDFKKCIVFHSLSKRSNMPGMRSGFVAGDSELIHRFLSYRTYHGCAMPIPIQLTSIALWNDEAHVLSNRDLYREKYRKVVSILAPVWPLEVPEASFYLWPKTPVGDELFAEKAFTEQNITLLPGRYLGRELSSSLKQSGPGSEATVHSGASQTVADNPGTDHVRMALVATVKECVEAAERLKILVNSL